MPPKDLYHDVVTRALQKLGWHITHEPFVLPWMRGELQVDIGAEQPDLPSRTVIAIEVKNFTGANDVAELQRAIGQYLLYYTLLEEVDPERKLYLAIPFWAYDSFFLRNPASDRLIANSKLRLVIFDVSREEVVEWIE